MLERTFSPTWFLIIIEYFGLRYDDLSFGWFSQFSVSLLTWFFMLQSDDRIKIKWGVYRFAASIGKVISLVSWVY